MGCKGETTSQSEREAIKCFNLNKKMDIVKMNYKEKRREIRYSRRKGRPGNENKLDVRLKKEEFGRFANKLRKMPRKRCIKSLQSTDLIKSAKFRSKINGKSCKTRDKVVYREKNLRERLN